MIAQTSTTPLPDGANAPEKAHLQGHLARPGNRRDQILDTALQLFAQNGMANVTTRQIAGAVGISQPSLYAHFRSADEIASELSVRAFDALAAQLNQTIDGPQPPARRLRQMARAYMHFGIDNPDMYRVAFMLDEVTPCGAILADADFEPVDPAMAAGMRCFDVMQRVVFELMGGASGHAELTAQMIWAHVHGLTSLLIARPEFPWVDREALIEAYIRWAPDFGALADPAVTPSV
jgi:AcrR family transcriptional regulator